jgi:RNA 2',3'-cyclic 3'-phosphodiesterase
VRTFIAIPVPEGVITGLVALQAELRRVVRAAELRWLKPEQMHLTLKFLGEVDPARKEELLAATGRACQGFAPFTLDAAQAGCFPHEQRPRVLWVGLGADLGMLQRLQESVEAATALFAEKQETRAFSPHLTLARIKSISPAEARALAARLRELESRRLGCWRVDCVRVMRSELESTGSRHSCLAEIALQASAEGQRAAG